MKMRSIIVNELTVTDPVRYKVYQDQVPATLALFGGQYVSRGTPEPIVGEAPSPRIVVLEFPSRERALAWFHAGVSENSGDSKRSLDIASSISSKASKSCAQARLT